MNTTQQRRRGEILEVLRKDRTEILRLEVSMRNRAPGNWGGMKERVRLLKKRLDLTTSELTGRIEDDHTTCAGYSDCSREVKHEGDVCMECQICIAQDRA